MDYHNNGTFHVEFITVLQCWFVRAQEYNIVDLVILMDMGH